MDLRIPDYIIDDKSYVSIYETETEMQVSMAASSFSETDVSAAGCVVAPSPPLVSVCMHVFVTSRIPVSITNFALYGRGSRSVSFGMFSGSASMSFAAESSKATSSSSGSKSKKVTIAYNVSSPMSLHFFVTTLMNRSKSSPA